MGQANLTPSANHDLRHRFEELQRRASKDALSGLLNRATVEHCIKQRLAEMAPEDTCALFIVDLDDFKKVNDTLGHQAGDQAIRKSAQLLSGLFRANDIVGRLGGDEFAVFLCGQITEELARETGMKICQALQLALGDGPVVELTASVGIYLSGGGQQFEGMYQSADLALYKAKKAGKHGFCLKSHDPYQEARGSGFRPVSAIPLSGLLKELDSGVALLEMGSVPQVTYVSPSFCRMIGAEPRSYHLPVPLSALIHPDDLPSLEQAIREGLQAGQAVEHTHRVISGDSERWLWWHIRAAVIDHDGPAPVMMVTTTDISRFKESEQRLAEINQRLQTAFDQTTQRVWEVDLLTKTFTAFDRDGTSRVLEYRGMDFPARLIDSGRVHPNSAARFQSFAQELLRGRSQGYGHFILRRQDANSYGWAALSYRMLFDEAGQAVRAVGIVEDLSKSLSEQDADTPLRRPLPEGLLADLMARMQADLTRDTVEALWAEGKDLSAQVRETPCSRVLAQRREKILPGAGQDSFRASYDRDQLLQLFREGRRWLPAEYPRADGSGNIRWVRHVVHLTQDPLSGNVLAHIYLIRSDPLSQLEQALGRELARDAVTQLFAPEMAEKIAVSVFPARGPGRCGVVLLQIAGLTDQPHARCQAPDQMRHDIAAALSVALGGGCIPVQYSVDQLLLLFPSVPSTEDLRRQLYDAISFVRQVGQIPDVDALRFIAGAAVQPSADADYHGMLAQAARICQLWWNAASDTVAFSTEDEDYGWAQLQTDQKGDQVAVHSVEMERPLSADEKDVAFHCISSMLSADSLDASICGVLHTIGSYYQADRVYILMLVENCHAITMPYEWVSAHKQSIQQSVSGARLDRFPLLERCMAERAPVFLTRTRPISVRDNTSDDRPWHFTTFPLIRHDRVDGFLCIENSRQHPGDAALFSTLIPYMLRERERFQTSARAALAAEQLMELPDLRSYMETVYSLNSDRYSSLGVVCLDIPGMASINGSLGFEYGSKLLWYVSKTLTDVFGPSLLFRTWEAEFIAFCPNTTRQVFFGRCGRLRSILQRRYPKRVRMGRVWASDSFNGRALVDEARLDLQAGQEPADYRLEPPLSVQELFPSVRAAAAADRLTVYFQPKIDMRTGALFGAEALVRGVEVDGTIVPPGQFIKALEERGSIRDLDLFVMEAALAQLDRWRAAGRPVIPVSVNLSRVTLLHPSTLASILAIQSRYPQIPAQALELEVTESAGGLETSDVRKIVDRLRSCGLRLALDDFGSQYANLPLFTTVEFDTVKLDRSLITELVGNPIDQMLIRDIVQICQARGTNCIAEGVESDEQIAALLDIGCRYAQGHYYDKPLPAEQFAEKYLRDNAPAEIQI